MGYCFVCQADGETSGLYRLPANEKRRSNWLNSLKMGGSYFSETKKDIRVCFRHFRDSDYKLTGTTLRLKPGMQLLHIAQLLRGYENCSTFLKKRIRINLYKFGSVKDYTRKREGNLTYFFNL